MVDRQKDTNAVTLGSDVSGEITHLDSNYYVIWIRTLLSRLAGLTRVFWREEKMSPISVELFFMIYGI